MKLTHLQLLAKRLGFIYLVYFVCRVLFLIFLFPSFHENEPGPILLTFIYGLIFDTSAIVYTNSVLILLHILPLPFRSHRIYQAMLKWICVAVNGSAVLLNLSDIGYYPFSGKRSGIELLNMKSDIADQSLQYLLDYWYLLLLWCAIIYAMIRFYPAQKTKEGPGFRLKPFLAELLIMPVIAALCFLGARGGLGLKPINTFDAARFVSPSLVSLTTNTPFQVISSVQQVGVKEKHYMSGEEAERIFNPVKKFDPAKSFARQNVVLIIVEGLGKEYVGYFNGGKGYTPFLDSLMQHSTVFTHAYANGKRSVVGLPSIIASMPSWMDDSYTSSFYQSNKLKSIGGVLKDRGYDASFYHGARNGTMSFDNFIGISEGGKYFGLNEYPDKKDFDGSWGIYDRPYLRYFLNELNKKPSPFFSTVFTLSSHHPYKLPDEEKNRFPKGTLPIHPTIGYVDDCLRGFFSEASKMPWYRNTLFVITADHSSENETYKYRVMEGMFRIPLVFFNPQEPVHREIDKTVQHLDIMPGILWLLHENRPFFSFGNNPFDTAHEGYAIEYVNGAHMLFRYPYVYMVAEDKGVLLSNAETDPEFTHNLAPSMPEKAKEMERTLKAVIQVYNNRLIGNRTHIE